MGRDIAFCRHCRTLVGVGGCHRPLFVFVDGACKNNGQPNAKAGVGIWFGPGSPHNASYPLSPYERHTSQRAELQAAIDAMNLASIISRDHHLSGGSPSAGTVNQGQRIPSMKEGNSCRCIKLLTDSSYVCQAYNEWIDRWEQNGYLNSRGNPIINYDLMKQLASFRYDTEEREAYCLTIYQIPRSENVEADTLARAGCEVEIVDV